MKIKKDIIKMINETEVEKRSSKIRSLLFQFKTILALSSDLAISMFGMTIAAILYYLTFGVFTLLSAGIVLMSAIIGIFIIHKFKLIDLSDMREECKQFIEFVRDFRDGKIDESEYL